MSLVPALDLRDRQVARTDQPQPGQKVEIQPPSNLEAEQALLGALLYDNSAFERIPDGMTGGHFFEPVHGRFFDAIIKAIRKGELAEPKLLHDGFLTDPAYQDLGGLGYLADMVDRAPPAIHARDYAVRILDLATRRQAMAVLADGYGALQNVDWDTEASARDVIADVETQLYGLAEAKSSGGFRDFGHYLNGALESAAAAYTRDGGLSGLATGLADLDSRMGGLQRSDLIIIAGRPSMGKTALATNIAFHIARSYAYEVQPDGSRKTVNGGQVGFFSLEMSGEQVATRIMGEVSGVPSDKVRRGEIDVSEFGRVRDAVIEIQEAPLHIDETGAINIGKLAARARRLKRTTGLDLIVVDYLQLAVGSKKYGGGERVQEVSEVTAALKALAKELNVPVVALSQLSRQVESREDKRPQLSDLRESGSIEQDADVVMFVYREAYYLSRAEPREGTPEHIDWQEKMTALGNVAEVIVAKQRHGPIGTVRLHFNGALTKFSNLAREGRFDAAQGRLAYKDDE